MAIERLKYISLRILCFFFIIAGINHFVNPGFYYPLIPKYLPFPNIINIFSGILEVVLGITLVFNRSKKYAAYGIIAMLIAFIPSHIYFIEIGGCVSSGLCIPVWLAWIRLIIIHPLLILWVWWHRN